MTTKQQDRISIMITENPGRLPTAKVLGWVDGNAIVRDLSGWREITWYTDKCLVNSKWETVPVEVIR